MHRNPVNFLYNSGHVTLCFVEVGLLPNTREGSMQEHNWAIVLSEFWALQAQIDYQNKTPKMAFYNQVTKIAGARPCRYLKVESRKFNIIRFSTGSQWSSISTGVI